MNKIEFTEAQGNMNNLVPEIWLFVSSFHIGVMELALVGISYAGRDHEANVYDIRRLIKTFCRSGYCTIPRFLGRQENCCFDIGHSNSLDYCLESLNECSLPLFSYHISEIS